jgi:hypothetical protein
MKKRSIQVFIMVMMVLCMLIPLFNATLSPVLAGVDNGGSSEGADVTTISATFDSGTGGVILEGDPSWFGDAWDWTVDKVAKAQDFIKKNVVGESLGSSAIAVSSVFIPGIGPVVVLILELSEIAGFGYDHYANMSDGTPYTEVFQIRTRSLDPWLPQPETNFDFASIDFINSELRATESTEALMASLDRVEAADSAGDLSYFRLQMQAAIDYTNMLIADLTDLATSAVKLYEEWPTYPDMMGITLTPEDVISYQEKLATEGFSEWELQVYKEGLLATDEDIEWIKAEILSIDPVAQWGEIQSALPGLHDVILSALPALDGLASEAERILSLIPVSPCFIATAAYGTPMAPQIQVLRDFRDQYLITNPVGKALVEFYYKVSPPMAEFITEHPALKPVVRAALVPAVALSRVAVNSTSAEKMAILGSLALVCIALAIWVRERARRLGRWR